MHSASALSVIVVHGGGSNFGVIFVVMRFFASTGVAQSMGMVIAIPFLSIVMTWLFKAMTVNGPAEGSSILLYLSRSSCLLRSEQERMVHVNRLSNGKGW